MSTLFSDTLTVSISSSRIRDCSSGYKTSQIGSSRLNALVISAKSMGLADVVAASRFANRVVETLHLVVEPFELGFHKRSIGILQIQK